ncbi:50S ribosomal protein L11 methyltransferase [Phaeobacter gallaeciensis]|uniref:RNA methylase n=1 Tax=Phaeobacter gallaeciensis TaxID=60890 RepID=A0AAC9Z729_9RHOB|nr:50S ribosomal protein L11 methyltransferase [Phaeobacter gallaeciensis]AHD08629.1 putative RNA methylase [Phaeobacter gallaeciensis DSM 26640]ATE91895.1 putative RNA methylase [Phaeobacter gallaeciensis]ATE98281.1 putative RNA methylase [Phaeobacter gallaeciensis]ATF00511.1 putative RNA methylase [Phaeobacter gallaeciensis]ATF04942.1 putative RNA methylase [Phaeobacter gallaeciensis]
MLKIQTPNPAPRSSQTARADAGTFVQLAKTASLADGGVQTSQLLAEALQLDPHHHEAQILQERLHQTFVPRWHFPMLADQARNRAYAEAIAMKVRPGDIVLDIGCGAGLTAMLAARAGAKHVYTCEQQPLIAAAATQVIADNGLSDRITVLSKWSHEIVIGVDMPEQADVVVSEIVDTVLLGEGALDTLSHAMAVLAKPGARAIPETGTLVAQLVESEALLQQWRPQTAEGFDLSAFHHLARVAQITPGDFAACGLRPLGPGTDLFQFDFTRPDVAPARSSARLGCTHGGVAHAVFVSFEMQLAPGIALTNGLTSDGHWGRTAFLLDASRRLSPGDDLQVTAQHDAAALSVSVHAAGTAVDRAQVWLEPAWRLEGESSEAPLLAALDYPGWAPTQSASAEAPVRACS